MKKFLALLLALVMLTAALTGCGTSASDLIDSLGSSDSDSGSGSSDSAASSEDLIDRYNSYVELYNLMLSGYISTYIGYYFDDVAAQEEFASIDGDYPYSTLPSSTYEYVQEAYDFAQVESEYSEVDAAVVTLYPTLERVLELLDEAAEYGSQKNYLDDDFAKAKEIHAELYPLLDTYYAQSNDFIDKFDALADAENEKELQELKDAGYEMGYTMRKIISVASDILDEFYMQDTIYTENINELDLTNITPLYEELGELVSSCVTYSKDTAMLEDEGFDTTFDTIHISGFTDAAMDLKACMAEIIQRVKDNNPPTDSELTLPEYSEGTFEAFSAAYSDMISEYNNLVS